MSPAGTNPEEAFQTCDDLSEALVDINHCLANGM
jgi:hypothetical protein